MGENGLAVSVMMLLLGGLALWDSLRRGRYLRVETTDGKIRKLRIRGGVDPLEAQHFVSLLG